ncbi:MAG: hypothetical protein HY329_14590 [Chloroflexi bacterium]|nr:hypothetical protein [Chloroflexota bacterium]
MRTIQAVGHVTPEGTLTVPVPPDIAPGEHQVVIMIDGPTGRRKQRAPLNIPADDFGPWPEGLTLRREDLYDEWGR